MLDLAALVTNESCNRLRLAPALALLDDDAALIDNADARSVERHVDTDKELHDVVLLGDRAGQHLRVARFAVARSAQLHRQAEIYAREDIDLSRSTLADMVGQVAALVRPLIDALSRYVMAGERVHGDDTEVPVLEPGLGRTRKARLWTYVRAGSPYGCADPPAILYRYSPDP